MSADWLDIPDDFTEPTEEEIEAYRREQEEYAAQLRAALAAKDLPGASPEDLHLAMINLVHRVSDHLRRTGQLVHLRAPRVILMDDARALVKKIELFQALVNANYQESRYYFGLDPYPTQPEDHT